jgi:hypothetical protein
MKDERPPEGPADEEELRSAAALARALEGGADDPDVPRAALETAALLRLSAGVAELGHERRDAIKHELLAGLPARSERRRRSLLAGWARWFSERGHASRRWTVLALPLAGTAVVCLLLLAKSPEPAASFADRSIVEHRMVPDRQMAANDPMAANEKAAADRGVAADNAVSGAQAAGRGAAAQAAGEPAPSFALPPRDSDAYARREGEAPSGFAPAEEARGIGARGTAGSASNAAPARRQAMLSDEMQSRSGAGSAVSNLAGAVRQPAGRAALVGLDKDVRAERSQLLARSNDAELSRAHAELDGAVSRAELERSQASLTRLLGTAADGLAADDARQVRQDLYCRLAETALRLGEPRGALEWTRRGIDLDGPPSPFLAQLMALEGDALAALGEPSSAAASYLKALRVHEALLDESLHGQ